MSRFPVTAKDKVEPLHPSEEPTREELAARGPYTFAEFMERTRRYFRLTQTNKRLHYARGLDSKPEDMA